tara:strand:+ start:2130 stop:3818 length:1689 start_codon:yes stop_codon:yes gene_type:complete
MSQDFSTKAVYDPILGDLSDKIGFDVKLGPANRTFQSFNSNSGNNAGQLQFSVNPPSESTILSRDIFVQSTVRFALTITNVAANTQAFQYGITDSLQSFPLNRIFNTVTLSLNNVSTSVNSNYVVSPLVRMMDQEYMQKCNGMTPTYLDQWGSLADAQPSASNPMGGYQSAGYGIFEQPRGCHPLKNVTYSRQSFAGGVPAGPPTDDSVSSNVTDVFTVTVDVVLTEEFIGLSPLVFGNDMYNKSGMLGINNMQIITNNDVTLKRFFSTSTPENRGYTLSLVSLTDSKLLMEFLTAPISLVLPPKITLPYASYTAYATQVAQVFPRRATLSSPLAGYRQENINSIQLEVIPEKFIIFVRRRLADYNARTADTFLEIGNVSITFGNKSGLLSNASQQNLYQLSKKNGLKNLNWLGFSGSANNAVIAGAVSADYPKFFPTAGSVLVIDPALDLGIDSPMLSNGSSGQFNLQMQVSTRNNGLEDVNAEIVVLAMRSGIVVTTSGTSTLTTNMLNSNMVLQSIEKYTPSGPLGGERMVGGGARSGGARSGGMSRSEGMSKLSALSM